MKFIKKNVRLKAIIPAGTLRPNGKASIFELARTFARTPKPATADKPSQLPYFNERTATTLHAASDNIIHKKISSIQ
jgi:hypothetical protein